MRDTTQILRSSCMSCDCPEFYTQNSARCEKCNCLATSHCKVDEIPGQFDYYTGKESSANSILASWIKYFVSPVDTVSTSNGLYFSVKGVHSVTLIKTQKQILLGSCGLFVLAVTSIVFPFQTGIYLGSSFSLRINAFLTFLTSGYIAWRTFEVTDRYSKKVTCASLIAINLFVAASYIFMGMGVFPRLVTQIGNFALEPCRYLIWLVTFPSFSNLIGDVTSNDSDMKWFGRIFYIQLLTMFIGHAFSSVGAVIAIELICSALLAIGLNSLFAKSIEYPSLAMMDPASTILTRTAAISGLAIIQLVWMAETMDLIQFWQAEILKTIADTILVAGITMAVSFSEMKELQICD